MPWLSGPSFQPRPLYFQLCGPGQTALNLFRPQFATLRAGSAAHLCAQPRAELMGRHRWHTEGLYVAQRGNTETWGWGTRPGYQHGGLLPPLPGPTSCAQSKAMGPVRSGGLGAGGAASAEGDSGDAPPPPPPPAQLFPSASLAGCTHGSTSWPPTSSPWTIGRAPSSMCP